MLVQCPGCKGSFFEANIFMECHYVCPRCNYKLTPAEADAVTTQALEEFEQAWAACLTQSTPFARRLPLVHKGGEGQPVTAPVSTLRYDMENAPIGGKLLLLNPSGVLVFGMLTNATRHLYWAWAPLPQRNKDEERRRNLV